MEAVMLNPRRSSIAMWKLLTLVTLLPWLTGCGHFWEDVTSRSPEPGVWDNVSYRWNLVFNRPDPLQVLASSTDGDMRRRALEDLQIDTNWMKPWQKTEEAEVLFRILATSAKEEPDTICRIKAIEKLALLQDPRVTQVLQECLQDPRNQQDMGLQVRIAVVQAFGRRRDDAAIPVLTAAMKDASDIDLRLAAAEALGQFKHVQAIEALVGSLAEERELALKHRSYLALCKATGRSDLPADAAVWQAEFQKSMQTGEPLIKEPNPFIKLVVWWKDE